MKTERIYIYENSDKVYLDVLLCDDYKEYSITKRPFMLICPGGGYHRCSAREAEPIARAYMAKGFNTAILYYSVKESTEALFDEEKCITKPHYEVAKSICIIRDNAEKWNVDGDKIAVIGFSAGGHLAGCSAILWNDEKTVKAVGCELGYNRPNAVILSYPVITSGEKAHRGSFDNLLGRDASSENLERFSLEKQVDSSCPPAFIWHTATDDVVPVENSTYLATALAEAGVNFELHIFPEGRHGMSLATAEVLPTENLNIARWLEWSVTWLKKTLDL